MDEFPELRGRVLKLTGLEWKRSAADVILSNIGWIAVTAGSGSVVTLRAYTPNGAGLYLREPALLPTSVRQRGTASPSLSRFSVFQYLFSFTGLRIYFSLRSARSSIPWSRESQHVSGYTETKSCVGKIFRRTKPRNCTVDESR